VEHVPQCSGSASVAVSHPFAALPSQSLQPGSHDTIPHCPLEHPGTPWAAAQTLAHVPQCAGLNSRSASQPFPSSASQLPNPEPQASPQLPDVHVGAAFAPAGHPCPQAPQWLTEELVAVSHPSPGSPLQLPNPATHAPSWHAEPTQLPLAFGNVHGLLQKPQCCAELVVSVSQTVPGLASHSARPGWQFDIPHTPERHTAVAPAEGQAVVQVPQCSGS
jgi:hypothetical protein